ncbi:SatD family protein [Galbibacter sp.]|jgi:hypothetical protein|uniref:SatD family protein n=1 Tax=Galbibacter sp. TaxID=2918471 RepID=UPI003A91BD9E
MISVITGDIVNSRQLNDPDIWLKPLKSIFKKVCQSEQDWEFYRGDSFQVELTQHNKAFEVAVLIKATVKMIKGLDVRMAIGVGEKTHQGIKVTESNGPAFIYSGEAFETLRSKKSNLAIKTGNNTLDSELNLYFKLALIAMDHWTTNASEIVKLSIENPGYSQQEIGVLSGIKQNTVSEHLKRAFFNEVIELNHMYQSKIKHLK